MNHHGFSRMAMAGMLLLGLAGCLRFVDVVVEDKGYDPAIAFPPTPKLSGPVPSNHIHFASRETRVMDESVGTPVAAPRKDESAETAVAETTLQDVYFDYDSWRLSEDDTHALVRDADWLRSHPSRMVIIEGHCDERGTAAYNLVLGEKRARSIRSFLVNLDVPATRVRTVSYGKERPFCSDADERCYRVNRRGHLLAQDGSQTLKP